MQERASRHLRAGWARRSLLLATQRGRQLIEEEGHAVLQHRLRGLRRGPPSDLLAGERDDLFAVDREELVQHGRSTLHPQGAGILLSRGHFGRLSDGSFRAWQSESM